MRSIKCCLWGSVVMCLSAVASLYGEGGDGDPAPLAKKTFKDIEAAFGERSSRIEQEPRARSYCIREEIEECGQKNKLGGKGFEKIKASLLEGMPSDFFWLKQDLWMVSHYAKSGNEMLKEAFASHLPYGCEVEYPMWTQLEAQRLHGAFRLCYKYRCEIRYGSGYFDCVIRLYKDTEVRLLDISLMNISDKTGGKWECYERPLDNAESDSLL